MLRKIVFIHHPERVLLRKRCLGVVDEQVTLAERNTSEERAMRYLTARMSCNPERLRRSGRGHSCLWLSR